jgi:hypothetical protein
LSCSGTLGAVDFDDCAPEVHFGEIAKLYLWVLDEVPFATQAEFDSAAHWATHISDSATTAGAIREFIIIGELAEPEKTRTPISGDRSITGFKKFTMSFEIDETNETNYNFMLLSECGGKYKACYETADGIIYGGFNGIEVSLELDQVIPKGRPDVVKIMGKMTWSSKNSPLRQISILA